MRGHVVSVPFRSQIGLEVVKQQIQLPHGLIETLALHLGTNNMIKFTKYDLSKQQQQQQAQACVFNQLGNPGTHLSVSRIKSIHVKLLLAVEIMPLEEQ